VQERKRRRDRRGRQERKKRQALEMGWEGGGDWKGSWCRNRKKAGTGEESKEVEPVNEEEAESWGKKGRGSRKGCGTRSGGRIRSRVRKGRGGRTERALLAPVSAPREDVLQAGQAEGPAHSAQVLVLLAWKILEGFWKALLDTFQHRLAREEIFVSKNNYSGKTLSLERLDVT
jgi:hypothetical protein